MKWTRRRKDQASYVHFIAIYLLKLSIIVEERGHEEDQTRKISLQDEFYIEIYKHLNFSELSRILSNFFQTLRIYCRPKLGKNMGPFFKADMTSLHGIACVGG